jgi:hypothetical protein
VVVVVVVVTSSGLGEDSHVGHQHMVTGDQQAGTNVVADDTQSGFKQIGYYYYYYYYYLL